MNDMNPSNISADDLNDPTIDAETLRDIAIARPDLRGVILQHPNCHAELANFIQNLANTQEGTMPGYPGDQAYAGQQPYGYQTGPYMPYAPQPPVSVSDEKTWGVLMHIGSLFLGFLAPLIVWLIYRERSQTLDQQGRTALNWQISAMIYAVVSSVLMFVLVGFVTIFVVVILDLIFCIIAAVKAGDREAWKYPLAIPFLQVNIATPPQDGQYH